MKRIFGVVALMIVLAGCGSKYPEPVGEVRCVDERNQVVDPEHCDELDDGPDFKKKSTTTTTIKKRQ